MPFRLDVALWGASLAITLARRGRLIFSTDAKYLGMKYTTWAIDYCYIGFMMYFIDIFLSANFTPENVFLHQVANSVGVVGVDILKAVLFSSMIPKAKKDHLKHLGSSLIRALFTVQGIKDNFRFFGKILAGQGWLREWDEGKSIRKSIRHQIWYFVKIGLISIPGVVYLQVKLGQFTCEPLNEIILIIGQGEWYECHISRFVKVYTEFLVMAFIKDAVCMNLLHQLFHTRFYDHHKIHHLPMKELSVVNAFYFDIFDLFVEDGIGPLLLIGLKALGGGSPSVHYMSFFFCVLADQTVHSCNLYTSVFWNPLLDNLMKGTLSHNLHHSLNRGHYTIWPLHHFVGIETPQLSAGKALDGFEVDIQEYNKIFDTKFPAVRV